MTALNIFDTVVGNLLRTHSRLLIAMDANSRSSLWDNSCLGTSRSTRSFHMGSLLEDIISKHGLYVHNNGTCTYRTGEVATAPDVTLSKGVLEYRTVNRSVTDDDLRSPHECILVKIGDRPTSGRVDVIDWPHFDWNKYHDETALALGKLYDDWSSCDLNDIDLLVGKLTHVIQECVEKVSTTRTISRHSKPWFTVELAERCKRDYAL